MELAREAAQVYKMEKTHSIIDEVRDARATVECGLEARVLSLPEIFKQLATAVILVFDSRLSDFHLREYVRLLYVIEGARIRAHNGAMHLYEKGAWIPFQGLIKDGVLCRVKKFMVWLEGTFRQLPA